MSITNNKWLKRFCIVTTIAAIALLCIKRKDMTWRQSIMKTVYSAIIIPQVALLMYVQRIIPGLMSATALLRGTRGIVLP